MRTLYIYSDASVRGNIKTYCFIILEDEKISIGEGFIYDENIQYPWQAELVAIAEGLWYAKEYYGFEGKKVIAKSDAKSVIDTINRDLRAWINTDFKGVSPTQKRNRYIWEMLYRAIEGHNVIFKWQKRRSDEFARQVDRGTKKADRVFVVNTTIDELKRELFKILVKRRVLFKRKFNGKIKKRRIRKIDETLKFILETDLRKDKEKTINVISKIIGIYNRFNIKIGEEL